jgi:hypothetical protein
MLGAQGLDRPGLLLSSRRSRPYAPVNGSLLPLRSTASYLLTPGCRLLLNRGMTGASGDYSFGPYFGPYATGRERPQGNGRTGKINNLDRAGPLQTA